MHNFFKFRKSYGGGYHSSRSTISSPRAWKPRKPGGSTPTWWLLKVSQIRPRNDVVSEAAILT
uniref:Uncharacterized protein n=1 Tax=Romanomermis culicivorax TaxID=13658 RepID=A0A915J7I2_ROMCU